MTIANINDEPRRPEPTGGPHKIVPGRHARSLAEVWRLTPAEVAAEYERLKRFPNSALTRSDK